MEPLIFKIETQADDSGVRQYDKSLGGLDVSSKKASGALKNFVKGLSEAKDGTDIASSALGAFGQVLGSSIAGTAIIIAGKTLIDSFNRIDQAVKESEKAVAEAFAGMSKASEAMTFAEATAQAKNFESVAETIRKKIKEINESPLDSIIDAITQSTAVMDVQALLVENQAKEIKRLGAESELAHLQKMQGLDAENKALELNSRALGKELDGVSAIHESETALAITRKYAIQADEIRAKFADERSKAETENASTRQKEIDARIKKEQELAATQQKRFNDLYSAEVKAQEDTQKRIDANLKAEKDLADNLQKLRDAVEEAKKNVPVGGGAVGGGGGGGTTGGRPSIPGLTKDPSQRPTSAEVGAQAQAQKAFIEGLKASAAALRQYVENQLKANGLAHDADAVTKKLTESTKDLAREQGKAQFGIQDFLDGVKKAAQELYEFQKTTQDAVNSLNKFDTEMSKVEPAFDKAINSAEHLADSITKNTGDMVSAFLKTETKTTDLGKDFSDLGKTVDELANKLDKVGDKDKGKEKGKGKGLDDIHKLLDDNLKEMRTYAFVK